MRQRRRTIARRQLINAVEGQQENEMMMMIEAEIGKQDERSVEGRVIHRPGPCHEDTGRSKEVKYF